MPNHKHLTFDDRSYIHANLNAGHSFRYIAHHLDKDPSTISKEVRLRRIRLSWGAYGRIPNKCIHVAKCTIKDLCDQPDCPHELCRRCKKCNSICAEFKEEHCPLLIKPPYVCNDCESFSKCTLSRFVYQTAPADRSYRASLAGCREGLSYTESEIQYMDKLITPLVKKKQSIHHIYVTQANNILCSERTIYKLIEQGVLTVRNIDLPRKVRYRPRRKDKPFKVDKGCRIGRTWQDFQQYMQEHPDTPIVQMDSVEGKKGGKIFLTIFFTQSNLLLIFIRDRNTSQSVINIFNCLYETLGAEVFKRLFPVCITDNGSEFSNPHAIEYDAAGQQRTRIFYCDPSSPHQKAEIERVHEFIRMVLPKGVPFDPLVQSDVDTMACHINSLVRKKLNDMAPTATFSFFHGDLILQKLGLRAIPPDEVMLTPALLSAPKEVGKLEKDL